jgi:hypothetical protein
MGPPERLGFYRVEGDPMGFNSLKVATGNGAFTTPK